jgi:Flp pilus assembly protein TadG
MTRNLLRKRQRGQALPLAAAVIVAVVGALAFVVDLGFQMEARRSLQNAADSAALAGVALLPNNQLGAIQQGTSFAAMPANTSVPDRLCQAGSPPDADALPLAGHPNVYAKVVPGYDSASGVYTLTATVECTVGFSFGRILDLTQAPIRTSATAAIGSVTGLCPMPFALSDANGGAAGDGYPPYTGTGTPTLVMLKVAPSNSTSGNFHAIDLTATKNGTVSSDPGGANFRDNLAGSNCDVQLTVGEQLSSEPGAMNGPTRQGLLDRGFVSCSGGSPPSSCSTSVADPNGPAGSYANYDLVCPNQLMFDSSGNPYEATPGGTRATTPICTLAVPVIQSWTTDVNGRTALGIESFAMVFVYGYVDNASNATDPTHYYDQTLWGVFIQPTLDGDIGSYDPTAILAFRLIR